ncbi:hypothetical protein VNO78_24767 [Psophocarpus tetragonolobus]|uniref:Uncharacterized protein n=1 Tax=Psophocarpus tetragonolobus TaxID=3891 RepID=A0AAN9S5H6_PSOTE
MEIGFVTFEDEEQLKNSAKKSKDNAVSRQELNEENIGVDVPSGGNLDAETNNDNLAKARSVHDAMTPLVHKADQLEQKENSIMQILKKLCSSCRPLSLTPSSDIQRSGPTCCRGEGGAPPCHACSNMCFRGYMIPHGSGRRSREVGFPQWMEQTVFVVFSLP